MEDLIFFSQNGKQPHLFLNMEDDLNLLENGRRPLFIIEDNINVVPHKKDNLNIPKNKRRPQKNQTQKNSTAHTSRQPD